MRFQVVLFGLCAVTQAADFAQRVKVPVPEISHKELTFLLQIVSDQFEMIQEENLDEKERYRAYVSLIGTLFLLIKCGPARTKQKYMNILGLTLFNFESSWRAPYFGLALNIFSRDRENPRSLIRAAYCAYSLQLPEITSTLLEEFKLNKDQKRYRMSQIEQGMLKQITSWLKS